MELREHRRVRSRKYVRYPERLTIPQSWSTEPKTKKDSTVSTRRHHGTKQQRRPLARIHKLHLFRLTDSSAAKVATDQVRQHRRLFVCDAMPKRVCSPRRNRVQAPDCVQLCCMNLHHLAISRGSGSRGSPSRSPSKWNSIASRISRSTSSRLSPAAIQPDKSGTYAPQLVAPFSTITV